MRAIHWGTAAVLSAAAWLPAREAAAQTGFNGVITFTNYSNSGKASTFVQTTKGRKVRLDGMGGGGEQGSMIVDGDAKVMMMVEPAKKQYMTMTDEDMKQAQAMMGPMMKKAKGDSAKYSFSNTGRTETVAGVPCEVWRGVHTDQGKKEEGEACVASGVGFALAELTFANPMAHRGGAGYEQYEQYRQLVSGNKGILKVTKIEDGKPVPEMVATKIDRKPVSDDAFKPPAGYTEVKMGDMMKQAQGAMKQMQEKMKDKGQQ
jgi:uncharacterized protein DUF4412